MLMRQIEPLVLKAMNTYRNTPSIALQQKIIWLLCRLVALKVNYSVLDSKKVRTCIFALFLCVFFFLLSCLSNLPRS